MKQSATSKANQAQSFSLVTGDSGKSGAAEDHDQTLEAATAFDSSQQMPVPQTELLHQHLGSYESSHQVRKRGLESSGSAGGVGLGTGAGGSRKVTTVIHRQKSGSISGSSATVKQ